jgi:NAD(P)-dependent dehydrogenase (short-subunit alcohol dehydrogenase family)
VSSYLEEVFGLRGRTAVVTGGSSGIGRAMAIALARAGARILLVARRPAPMAEVVAELAEFGAEGHAIAADLADRAAVAQVIDKVLAEYGEPDVLVNSAGINRRPPMD